MAIEIRTSLAEPETGQSFVPHRPARPQKAEGGRRFVLKSDYHPAGDQPAAIREMTEAARAGERDQVLLGVTGSGKTFTMAKVIEDLQRPALILALAVASILGPAVQNVVVAVAIPIVPRSFAASAVMKDSVQACPRVTSPRKRMPAASRSP